MPPGRRRINVPKKQPTTVSHPAAADPGEDARDRRHKPPVTKPSTSSDPGEDARDRREAFGKGKFVDTIKNIKYNPGVHQTLLHTPGAAGVPNAPKGVPFKGSLETYMIPDDVSLTQRYGFRFHYNPTNYSMSYSMDSTIVANTSDMFSNNMYAHLQTISLSLFLNRQAEMVETNPKALTAPCTAADLVMLKKWGTLYDLEFLWAAINVADNSMRVNPGVLPHDLGYLQVSLLLLTLGRYYKMPVLLTQMNITHTKFTVDMVPVLSQVDMSFTRFSSADSSKNTLDKPQPTGTGTTDTSGN